MALTREHAGRGHGISAQDTVQAAPTQPSKLAGQGAAHTRGTVPLDAGPLDAGSCDLERHPNPTRPLAVHTGP